MSTPQPNTVTTGRARLSYVHLFQPHASVPGAEPRYGVTVLVPKTDVQTKAAIDAAIEFAKQQGAGKCWNGQIPPVVATPVYDGDGVRPSDGNPFGEECKGHWVFTASSKEQPQVVNQNVQPIINQSDAYSGMYAHVCVSFFPYANSGKKGVGCGLNAVQKVADGEPLSSRVQARDVFNPVAAPAPAYGAPAYQPAQYAPQQPAYQPQQPAYQPQPQYQPQAAPPQYAPVPAQYTPQQPQINPLNGQPYTPPPGGILGM